MTPSPEDKRRFLGLALAEASAGARAGHGGPFGAVVVKDGVVVAAACNQVVQAGDPTAHAEVEAVRLACRALGTVHLHGCDVYASCEPCPMCLFALCWARPRAVYFAATRAQAAAAGFADERLHALCRIVPADLPLHYEQVAHEDAARPFADFAVLPERVVY